MSASLHTGVEVNIGGIDRVLFSQHFSDLIYDGTNRVRSSQATHGGTLDLQGSRYNGRSSDIIGTHSRVEAPASRT